MDPRNLLIYKQSIRLKHLYECGPSALLVRLGKHVKVASSATMDLACYFSGVLYCDPFFLTVHL